MMFEGRRKFCGSLAVQGRVSTGWIQNMGRTRCYSVEMVWANHAVISGNLILG